MLKKIVFSYIDPEAKEQFGITTELTVIMPDKNILQIHFA
jgi:hypothetical protein